ncbi:MAG: FmdB family zinc ribbon protein [Thermodesulfobacteriota bacterium]
MPLYEYHCFTSVKELETLVADSDEVVACNTCDSANVEKIYSSFGVSSSRNKSNDEDSTLSNGCKSTCCCCN